MIVKLIDMSLFFKLFFFNLILVDFYSLTIISSISWNVFLLETRVTQFFLPAYSYSLIIVISLSCDLLRMPLQSHHQRKCILAS